MYAVWALSKFELKLPYFMIIGFMLEVTNYIVSAPYLDFLFKYTVRTKNIISSTCTSIMFLYIQMINMKTFYYFSILSYTKKLSDYLIIQRVFFEEIKSYFGLSGTWYLSIIFMCKFSNIFFSSINCESIQFIN